MKIKNFKTKEEASKFASDFIIQEIKNNGQLNIGLATGSTPILMYKNIAKDFEENKTDWSNVTSFNLDEYLGLEITHPQSYHVFMEENLFSKININKDKTFFPDNKVNYDELIDQKGGIDVQILGIGVNGHIGFNEPGSTLDSKTRVVDLTNETIKSNADLFFDGNLTEVPKTAISMGINTIIKAKKIILIAFGENKHEAIKDLINSKEFKLSNPSTSLINHPDVTIIIDEEVGIDL